MAEPRFKAVDKSPGGAQITDTIDGRTIAIFLPKPGSPKAAKLLADHAARAINDWWRRIEAERARTS
jgi:hypothetical protein